MNGQIIENLENQAINLYKKKLRNQLEEKINKLIEENETITRNNERKEIIRVVYKEILELIKNEFK